MRVKLIFIPEIQVRVSGRTRYWNLWTTFNDCGEEFDNMIGLIKE